MFRDVAIVFVSIFFESLPFLILGSLISSIIENYVSNETLVKLIPKNKVLGTLMGIVLGFFLPACDCAVIPVSKRLAKKKVPLNVVISFMLASPIINPVVLLSTYYAFYQNNPEIFWYRLLFGVGVAFIIGVIMGILFGKEDVAINNISECECHEHEHHKSNNLRGDITSILRHTAFDLFEVVKYLMFGALLASLAQVLLPRDVLGLFNDNQVLSIITLMLFAYLISLCSTSDSFVGKSLLSSFSKGSVMAYLILGPMIDIKNTMVLLGNYKKKFVWVLISLIFLFTLISGLMVVFVL